MKGHGLAAALFRHVASRDLDPQLHTHAVVANMTRDAQGRWKSIEPTLLCRNARLIGAFYRNELSRRLIERGYSVVPAMAGRLQSFEIAGYDKALRDAFSTRRRQILAYIDEKGWERGEAEAQIAALATRKQKEELLHGMLREIWAGRAAGPWLFLGLVARSEDSRQWECLRARAQPVVSTLCPVPVDSHAERRALGTLRRLVRGLDNDPGLREALGGGGAARSSRSRSSGSIPSAGPACPTSC